MLASGRFQARFTRCSSFSASSIAPLTHRARHPFSNAPLRSPLAPFSLTRPSPPFPPVPQIQGKIAFICKKTADPTLFAFNTDTKATLWAKKGFDADSACRTKPALGNDGETVYVLSDQTVGAQLATWLTAVNVADGAEVYKVKLGAATAGTNNPTAVHGHLLNHASATGAENVDGTPSGGHAADTPNKCCALCAAAAACVAFEYDVASKKCLPCRLLWSPSAPPPPQSFACAFHTP